MSVSEGSHSPLLVRTLGALGALLLLAAACTSGSGQTPSPSPPPRPGPAWLTVLGQIGPDGSVSTGTALQAFSLAFGPLPGVTPPPGDPGTITSGTAALRWLVGHWKDITPEQRAAAAQFVPELQGLEPPPPASGGVGLGMIAASQLAAQLPAILASQKRSNYFYTHFAEQIAQEIGSRVGHPLGISIEAHVGPPQKATSYADTGVYSSSYDLSGPPAKCVITVGPSTDALVGDDLGSVLAHEVWHCFEGEAAGLIGYWYGPSWIIEGEAEWVGDSLYPNAPVDQAFWPPYLTAPSVPLFQRSYDALGFYSQLDSSGTDVWSKLIPILKAKDNAGAFTAAGADGDQFLNAWAAGYIRDPSRGAAWDIVGPGVTSDRATPANAQLANDQSVKVSAAPYANAIDTLDVTADVVEASFSGPARISDSAGNDYLIQGGGAFCHRDGGCACPGDSGSGNPPMPALTGPGIALGVTGGPNGSNGAVTGISLDDYCSANLSGTWAGTWQSSLGPDVNGGFTLLLTQKGKRITGTEEVNGPTCIRHPTIEGIISGSTIHFTSFGETGASSAEAVVSKDGKSMSGTYSIPFCGGVPGNDEGTWEASKVG